jgi:hypothetical protein
LNKISGCVVWQVGALAAATDEMAIRFEGRSDTADEQAIGEVSSTGWAATRAAAGASAGALGMDVGLS